MRLLVLVGPTASGKTRCGVEVAHRLGTEIISADSRQVYRGLDIGSGKDLDEYRRLTPPVPVHLIDVADPREIYTLFRFQMDCYRLFAQKEQAPGFDERCPLVMVGGTGLFVEAVLRGYRIPDVPEDEALRERLESQDHADLSRQLQEMDEDLFRRTDVNSKRRVVRALEIAQHSLNGPVVHSPPPPVHIDAAVFAITVPPDELGARIDRRLDERLGQGLVEEVRGLLAAGLPPKRLAKLGLEYREVAAYLAGEKTREKMVEDLRTGIRQFAKRQRTWFRGLSRRGIDVNWIEAGDHAALLEHPLVVS